MKKLKMALPSGSLQEATISLMNRAGFHCGTNGRSYFPYVDDPELELMLIRAQEIAKYVELGVFDAGITGEDWIRENRAEVRRVEELVYAKQSRRPVRWVLAVPNNSPYERVEDLEGKRIATEAVNLTSDYLNDHGVEAQVEFSWGATEVKAPFLVDAIVEVTETGSSLRANNLRIIDTVLESTPKLITNHRSWEDEWKREKVENMAMLLKGAILAENKVGLKMNVSRKTLPGLLEALPAMKNPTISELSDSEWVAVETIVDEVTVRTIIPQLRRAGARDIIEYPLNKAIY